MAEEQIKAIYQDAMVLTRLKEAVRLLHIGNDSRASLIWNDLIAEWDRICRRYEEQSAGAGTKLMEIIRQTAKQGNDYLAFADAIEDQLLPELQKYMGTIGDIRIEEGQFELTSSAAGYLSLEDTKYGYLIHERYDPMESARVMAESLYRPKYEEYCILGSGLGYLAYQLYLVSDGVARIRVYETEKKLQYFAKHYGVLDRIPRSNLYVERDLDVLKFLCYVDEHKVRCVISDWAMPYIPENERDALDHVMISYAVSRNVLETNFAINFWKNMEIFKKSVQDIPKKDWGEEFIVVAAGPSLDQSMDFLAENYGKMPVIAVGTVFRKLLNRGMPPDFVAILESHELVYEQFKGLEDQKVPVLLPLCGYWKIGERYQGDIYFYASCDSAESVKYAKDNDLDIIWEVGGTVSYTAMVAAVRLGAKKVYLLGLDLAYPEALSHAQDTPEYRKVDLNKYELVDKVGGGKVHSEYVFSMYRGMIEEYVASHPEVSFYNLSKVGARIKGTIEC